MTACEVKRINFNPPPIESAQNDQDTIATNTEPTFEDGHLDA